MYKAEASPGEISLDELLTLMVNKVKSGPYTLLVKAVTPITKTIRQGE